MKKLLLTLLVNLPFILQAQVKHFIYFQTEGKQPFYAKLDRKLFSSSASGYLIIPRLQDGTYTISIGFPKGENAEQQFTCKVDNNDAGYLVKNFGDKGWGLFNLQTLDVAMAGTPGKDVAGLKEVKSDAFSSMLSDAVNDPAIRKAEKPVEAGQTAQRKVLKPDPLTPVLGQETPEPATSIAMITKKLVNYGLDGIEMMYIDGMPGKEDTVRIWIPNEIVAAKVGTQAEDEVDVWEQGAQSAAKKAAGTVETKPEIKKADAVDSAAAAVTLKTPSDEEKKLPADGLKEPSGVEKELRPDETKKIPAETKFLPVEMEPVKNTKEDSSAQITYSTQDVGGRRSMINSDCKELATEDDFLKLRKKMAGEGDEEKMLAIARKAFKTRCFSTDQVKYLAVLFLNDAGKYRFFDLAFQFVSDSHNFSSLQSLLTDTYYLARFKAMVNR